MTLDVRNLTVTIGSKTIVNNVSFLARRSGTMAIMGPSGAGKTTLLRTVAGLQQYAGTILLNGRSIDATLVADRNTGMVSQEDTLFPHLTVFDNIAYPLFIRKYSAQKIHKSVNVLLERFGIKTLAERIPQEVSGGEKQRVQLARAIIYKPRILLLDEPFVHLDTVVRYDLLHWLKKILRKERTLTLYVTHHKREAMFMSNRILFLEKGKIQFLGPKSDLTSSTKRQVVRFLKKSLL